MNDPILIQKVETVTDEIVAALNHLLPQLNPDISPISREAVQKIVDQKESFLFMAKDAQTNEFLGTLTLISYHTPGGPRGYIEDVVVDDAHRGKGIGKMLVQKGIDTARDLNLTYVGLTSRPERVAANALYQQLGFKKRNTNIYRLLLS